MAMTSVPRVLIVEDDADTVQTWKLLFGTKAPDFPFQVEYAASLAEAEEVLSGQRIDAIIIDLRLAKQPNEDGLQVLELFRKHAVGIAAFFTGQATADLDELVDEAPKGTLQVFQKGAEGHEQAFGWLSGNWQLLQILKAARARLVERLAEVFHGSLWPRWQHWFAEGAHDPATIEAAIARHMAAHLYAQLLEDDGHKVLNEEWFFVPPIRDGLRTGDLLRVADRFQIVITPKCDLARATCAKINLIDCVAAPPSAVEAEAKLAEALRAATQATEKRERQAADSVVTKARNAVRTYWSGNGAGLGPDTYYLPTLRLLDGSKIGPLVADFRCISTIDVQESGAREKLIQQRVAALTPEFLPTFVARFGAYFSRFGQLDPL